MPTYLELRVGEATEQRGAKYRVHGLSHNPAKLVHKKVEWKPGDMGDQLRLAMAFGLIEEHKTVTVRINDADATKPISESLPVGGTVGVLSIILIHHDYVNTSHGRLPAFHRHILTLTVRDVLIKNSIPDGNNWLINMVIRGSVEASQNA